MDLSKPVNVAELRRMREAGEKIACLTCYDASFALIEDRAGVDLVLVGDSLGMVIHGRATTTAVTVADIVYHCRALKEHLKRAFLVADMPFLSFATRDRALDAAQRMMQEGGAKMVKLEGGREQADIVEYLTVRGVPVIGIGAGPHVDGQILVLHDILNISPTVTVGRKPRFVRNFMDGAPDIQTAINNYVQAVKDRSYPAADHCF